MKEKPLLSLCMIVKNEVENIERCLESVIGIVDEIIIVDTGSTDQTIEICKRYNAKIYPYSWNGHFANARNHGIEHAAGEWILWMDADEALDKEHGHEIRNISSLEDKDLVTLQLINYYGKSIEENNIARMNQIRIFRNIGIRFQNAIHEVLDIPDILNLDQEEHVYHSHVKIHHYGYLDEAIKKKQKSSRNIPILQSELKKKESGWNRFYLAFEYYRLKHYKEAFENVNLAIRTFLENGLKPPSMCYLLKYSILLDLKSFDGFVEGISRAILLYPDYVDLWHYLGIALFQQNNYEKALEVFDQCLQLGDNNLDYYTVQGVGSYKAWQYKALCYEKLGHKKKAMEAFEKSLEPHAVYSDTD